MEKHLQVLSQALNKGNLAGAFNLQESVIVAQALGEVIQALGVKQPNPIEDARAEAKAKNAKPIMEVVEDDLPKDDGLPKNSKKNSPIGVSPEDSDKIKKH